jgi:hypothetical protein
MRKLFGNYPTRTLCRLAQEITVTYLKDNPEISEIFQPGTNILMIVLTALVALPLTYYAFSHL